MAYALIDNGVLLQVVSASLEYDGFKKAAHSIDAIG
jgi:hypothetical protein